MWRIPEFKDFLRELQSCEYVQEIIIIDNNYISRPSDILFTEKIKLVKQENNIGVNPAWNLGVDLALNNNLCIANDDLQFDCKVFQYLQDKVTQSVGMIGLVIQDQQSEFTLEMAEDLFFGYACTFFINKNNYIHIPEDVKIFFGDNWLFYTNKHLGRPNKKIFGMKARGFIEATSKDYKYIFNSDKSFYEKFYDNFIKNNYVH